MKNEGKIVVGHTKRDHKKDTWFFKLVAENHKVLVISDTYKSKQGVAVGIKAVQELMTQDKIRVEMESGVLVEYLVNEHPVEQEIVVEKKSVVNRFLEWLSS